MFLKSLRICGDVLINFAVASLGTAILEAELEHVIDRQTLYSLKNYLLVTGAVAFGLGCTVYLKWRLRASLWLWLPGLAGLLWQLAHRGKFPTFYDFARLGNLGLRFATTGRLFGWCVVLFGSREESGRIDDGSALTADCRSARRKHVIRLRSYPCDGPRDKA